MLAQQPENCFELLFFIRTYPSSAKWQALQEYVGRLKLMKASFKPKMESLKSEPALFYLRRMLNYVNQYFYWRVNFKTFVGNFFRKNLNEIFAASRSLPLFFDGF
jgi:hypothetical protein